MTDAEPTIIVSKFSRTVTLEGASLEVRIYRLADEPDWILEVVNEDGTSTVWQELFATEIDALAEFQSVVQDEGIGAFLDDDGTETLH